MLKRITFIIILIVFAKPAYDLVSPLILSEVESEPVSTLPNLSTSKPTSEIVTNNQQAKDEQSKEEEKGYPNKISSLEALTEAFYYNFSQYNEHFTIHYTGKTSNIDQLIEEASKAASRIDPFIEGHLNAREISYTYNKLSAKIDVKQSYLITASQAGSIAVTVDDIITQNKVMAKSDFEKIKFVNDYIVQNTVYSTDTNSSPHSAYTVLAEGKAVCQGYALLAQMMLTKLGIDSLYVVGDAGGVGHAWNLVKLNGNWYHLDTTWNDPVPDRGPNFTRYAYFLMSDQQIAKDHTWERQDYPAATDSQYAYMHVVADSYDTGQFIYFSHEQDNNYLYKLDKTTKQSVKVMDTRVQYVTGLSDTIYFSNYSNGGYLTELHLPSLEINTLIRKPVKNLFVYEGYLYFTSDDGNEKIPL